MTGRGALGEAIVQVCYLLLPHTVVWLFSWLSCSLQGSRCVAIAPLAQFSPKDSSLPVTWGIDLADVGGWESSPACDHWGVSEQTVITGPTLLSALLITAWVSLSGYALPRGTLYPEVSFQAWDAVQQTDLFSLISDQLPWADDKW